MTHDAFTLKTEQLLECFKVYNECINNYNNNCASNGCMQHKLQIN